MRIKRACNLLLSGVFSVSSRLGLISHWRNSLSLFLSRSTFFYRTLFLHRLFKRLSLSTRARARESSVTSNHFVPNFRIGREQRSRQSMMIWHFDTDSIKKKRYIYNNCVQIVDASKETSSIVFNVSRLLVNRVSIVNGTSREKIESRRLLKWPVGG